MGNTPRTTPRTPSLPLLGGVALALASAVVFHNGGCAGLPDAAPTPPAAAPAAKADLMAGHWEGSWASDSKPFGGKLTADIARQEDGSYRAVFDAESPIGNNHSVFILHVTDCGEKWTFEGKEDIGLLRGGTYTYTGSVDGRRFACTYDSAFDKGTFRMERKNPN